jgi:energy-coupling factor transport system permease protein
VLAAAGTWIGGQQVRRSIYRPDPWRAPEWATAACGLTAVATMLFVGHTDPNSLTAPLQPLAVPALPLVATAGILVAGLAAIVSPVPQSTARQVPMPVPPPVSEPAEERLHR